MNRPTEPLIRIDKGTYGDADISDATATLVDVHNPEYGYYLLGGPLAGQYIWEGQEDEEITAYRPCTAVPIGELSFLRNVFMGAELSVNQNAAIQRIISYLPKVTADHPNDPLVPKIKIGERGDGNRVTVTIDMAPLSSTYDVP
jgi:hypothetical protein|nr:MAG TPA: hypothetical protein [Caudoviricetes sp.]